MWAYRGSPMATLTLTLNSMLLAYYNILFYAATISNVPYGTWSSVCTHAIIYCIQHLDERFLQSISWPDPPGITYDTPPDLVGWGGADPRTSLTGWRRCPWMPSASLHLDSLSLTNYEKLLPMMYSTIYLCYLCPLVLSSIDAADRATWRLSSR